MEPEDSQNTAAITGSAPPSFSALLIHLRSTIAGARLHALRAVDVLQVQTCWELGRHIVEFEQGGADRARYGARLLPLLAKSLTVEFGKGFDARSLRHFRQFYLSFPIRNALRSELSWTHYRTLLKVEREPARLWYMHEAADQNWISRALDRQISTLYYERLLASRDKDGVRQEAIANMAPLQRSPREFVRDPVLLEFLGLPESGRTRISGRWTCTCGCMTTCTARTTTTRRWASSSVRRRMRRWCGTRCCTGTSSCSRAGTGWCCQRRRSCGGSWKGEGRRGKHRGNSPSHESG